MGLIFTYISHSLWEAVKASLNVKIFLLKVSGFAHTQVKDHQCLGSKAPIPSASLQTVPYSFLTSPSTTKMGRSLSIKQNNSQYYISDVLVLRSYFYTYKMLTFLKSPTRLKTS